MDKYKINRNRKPLTDDDVQKGQNFDAFLKAYSDGRKPFYKKTSFYVTVVSLGIFIGVGTYLLTGGDEKNPKAESAFVNPPLAELNIADTTFKLDAANGGNFQYNTGSMIRVPEGAFLDSSGNVVKGNVEIHYREFHDPAEIFLAGIPMTYDSAGQRFHFESAGMLEITAWQNGKLLKANPTSPIKVDMASDNEEQKFNVYYLDTVKKNWNFIAKDKGMLVGFVNDSTKKDSVPKLTASIAAPIAPRKAENGKQSFVIKYDPIEFPELNAYKGVRFEVDEVKTPYDKNDKKLKWEDVQILRNKDGATYTVTFTKDDLSRTYITYAVVDEKNYADAKKVYDQRYAAYQNDLKKKQDAITDNQKKFESRLMNADAHRIFVNDTVLRWSLTKSRQRNLNGEKEDMVMREFQIQNFGIWNSDCPASLPQGEPMFVKLFDSRSKKIMQVDHLYLVEKGRNAIYTFYASDLARFQFNADAENLVWAVSTDGKLATATGDDLKNMKSNTVNGNKEFSLTLTVQSEKLTSVTQAKAVLGI
jgi:hypothetical protein